MRHGLGFSPSEHTAGSHFCNRKSRTHELTAIADQSTLKAQMKTLLRHLLLLGALCGLLWQGVAYASPPCAEMQHAQIAVIDDMPDAMAGMPDCMDAERQSHEDGSPCKDMKAGCFAMAGCAPLVGLGSLPFADCACFGATAAHDCSPSAALVGRADAPIPDPPTILG